MLNLNKSQQTYCISSLTAKVIVLIPFAIILLYFILWSTPITRSLAYWMVLENRPVELLTFFSLFAAGIMGWKLAYKAKDNTQGAFTTGFYMIFSIGLLFVAMEEISWGQWFFGFETPAAVEAINKQKELNLHNIPGFHAPFEVLRVLFGVGGLFGVWLASQKFTRNIGSPAILSTWFVCIAILAGLDFHNYYFPYQRRTIFIIAARMVEVLELLIGLSAFLYMWLNGRMFSKEWAEV